MVKAINTTGTRHSFTCGEWENLAPGSGWTELENTCGSVLDSFHRPFAASDYVQQIGSIGRRPLVKTVEAADFTAGVLDLATVGIVTDYDYPDMMMVFEGGQLQNLIKHYTVDVPNNQLTILQFIEWQTYTIIYFQS